MTFYVAFDFSNQSINLMMKLMKWYLSAECRTQILVLAQQHHGFLRRGINGVHPTNTTTMISMMIQ